MNYKQTIATNWMLFLKSKKNIFSLAISFLSTVVMLHLIAKFITKIEYRSGFAFDDPLLSLFQPINLSWVIFFFLYVSVLFSFFILLQNPEKLILAFFSYAFLLLLRTTCMYLLPLDPPKDIILLKDPIIEYFGTERALTRDLFFSGHTSLVVLLFLLVKSKPARLFLSFSVIVVAFGVLLQKAHYTVDVLVAFFAAYCSYSWTQFVLKKFKIIDGTNP
ncbi:MAG: phosphatase PAP2-related protein [Candidatus Kapaibacteriota bacterium]